MYKIELVVNKYLSVLSKWNKVKQFKQKNGFHVKGSGGSGLLRPSCSWKHRLGTSFAASPQDKKKKNPASCIFAKGGGGMFLFESVQKCQCWAEACTARGHAFTRAVERRSVQNIKSWSNRRLFFFFLMKGNDDSVGQKASKDGSEF